MFEKLIADAFLVRGWTITLVAALLALAAGEAFRPELALVAYVPILVFWILDGYFLWQERLFRAHYDAVRQTSENHIDFNMDIRSYIGGRMLIFYLALLALTTVPTMLLFEQ